MYLVLGRRMAEAIKRANPKETASVEVMAYALTNIVHSGTIILAALLLGSSVHHLVQTTVALLWFMGLRLLTGGYHFKSLHVCALFSISVVVGIPFLTPLDMLVPWADWASVMLLGIFAPTRNKSRFPDMAFKAAAILAVLANGLLVHSFTASITILIVSIMTISKKGG